MEVESQTCPRIFLAQHQHWEPRPPPTPSSSALLSTCLVLNIWYSPWFQCCFCSFWFLFIFLFLFFFWKVTWTQRKLELNLNNASQSMDQTRVGGRDPKKSWISKSLFKKKEKRNKKRPGLNMHMLARTQHTTVRVQKRVYACVRLDLSVFHFA